jgi:hypothetical protein
LVASGFLKVSVEAGGGPADGRRQQANDRTFQVAWVDPPTSGAVAPQALVVTIDPLPLAPSPWSERGGVRVTGASEEPRFMGERPVRPGAA